MFLRSNGESQPPDSSQNDEDYRPQVHVEDTAPKVAPDVGQPFVIEERRKPIKALQQYHSKKSVFDGSFESNWHTQVIVYLENCSHWDIPNDHKALFFMYTLANSSNAR